ncbi:MAG: dethiobiotin synthase [Burkholderiaceae bacterium]|jgi:dethiobiotin synthetase|nr:dethiobiotin synthase [Burkholderiaceae bacterium]
MKAFSCFVTGTDTGVGKTLVTCALMHSLSQQGITTAGMKPVASGASLQSGEWQNEDTNLIISAASLMLPHTLVTPYTLKNAISPNIAAHIEHTLIEWPRIRDCYEQIRQLAASVIVEGIGGFMTPFSGHYHAANLAVNFGLPVVLVVGVRLGCLNHALLTTEAILSRGLTLAGWVANMIDPMMPYSAENVESLEHRIPAPRLATIPYIDAISIIEASSYFDLSKLSAR